MSTTAEEAGGRVETVIGRAEFPAAGPGGYTLTYQVEDRSTPFAVSRFQMKRHFTADGRVWTGTGDTAPKARTDWPREIGVDQIDDAAVLRHARYLNVPGIYLGGRLKRVYLSSADRESPAAARALVARLQAEADRHRAAAAKAPPERTATHEVVNDPTLGPAWVPVGTQAAVDEFARTHAPDAIVHGANTPNGTGAGGGLSTPGAVQAWIDAATPPPEMPSLSGAPSPSGASGTQFPVWLLVLGGLALAKMKGVI